MLPAGVRAGRQRVGGQAADTARRPSTVTCYVPLGGHFVVLIRLCHIGQISLSHVT